MQKTLLIKLSIIAGLCLFFGIGLTMIGSLITERQQYSEDVVREIAQQHINPQQVITPFIAIPTTITPKCSEDASNKNYKCRESYTGVETLFANQTASTQDLAVSTDTYKRGIYHATSYNGHLVFDQRYTLEQPKRYASIIEDPSITSTVNTNPKNGSSTVTHSGNTRSTAADSTTKTLHWDKARLIIPVSDLRGVTTLPMITINKTKLKATYPQSLLIKDFSYVEALLPASLIKQINSAHSANPTAGLSNTAQADSTAKTTFNVLINLPLSGISTLSTVPTGQNFELTMTSNWHAPNFIGKALPNAKTLTKTGFKANWQNQYLTIANNQQLSNCLAIPSNDCRVNSYTPLHTSTVDYDRLYDGAIEVEEAPNNSHTTLSSFGVSFSEPNDVYLQTERTMKYALLLILVSFGTFFLFEVIKSSRIHPIQYLLVGCALLTFYVLLLPLAEQIAFWMAYTIAATACVGLIGWYSYYLLGNAKRAILFTAILGGLYAAFYGILTTEDLNLLLGALFCFALLACVMVMTRKIDWYKVA